MSVRRVYVEKKAPYAVKRNKLAADISDYLGITSVTGVRVLQRYDIEDLSDETYETAKVTVFSEPPLDDLYETDFPRGADDVVFSVEFLPGQFDQRADSCEQCLKLLNEKEEPIIRSAVTYVFSGAVTEDELAAIRSVCINPVDSRVASDEIPETLNDEYDAPADVEILEGFTAEA